MRQPRVRISLRSMMIAVAFAAVLLLGVRSILDYLKSRNGHYAGSFLYLGDDWRLHKIRGSIICVKDGKPVFID